VLAFKLNDFLTGNATLHTGNSAAASWRDRSITLRTENTVNARHSGTGIVDMALTVFLFAQLGEVHRISH
jgi:hypothetical protein